MKTLQNYCYFALPFVGLILILGCNQTEGPTIPEGLPSDAPKALSKNMPCVPAPSDLVSWWPADGNADDIVGANDGTLVNGATFAPGMVAEAFSFDGTDDYVNTNDLDLPSTFTFSAWMFPNTVDGIQVILSKDDGGTSRSYFLEFDNGGKLVGSVRNTAGAFTQYRTTQIVLSAGQWNYMALTYDGSLGADQKFQIYVDAQNVAANHLSPHDNGGVPENNALRMTIGIFGDGLSHPFDGLIDELEIYSRVLSASEIQAIFNAGSAGKCKLSVEIDIKPGSDPNSINLKSKGVIPVAVLTTPGFDATTVVPLSVTFGPNGATESHGRGHIEDVDNDGDQDMLLHFRTQETGIANGDTEACLTGTTVNGISFRGCDSIVTVGSN